MGLAIEEILNGDILMAWKDEDLDATMLKSTPPLRSRGLPPKPAGCAMGYCTPCMLLGDGMALSKNCMAPGGIAEVRASWFAGSVLEVPSVSLIKPSLVADSRLLGAEEAMEGVWCPVGGTTSARAVSSRKRQPGPFSFRR